MIGNIALFGALICIVVLGVIVMHYDHQEGFTELGDPDPNNNVGRTCMVRGFEGEWEIKRYLQGGEGEYSVYELHSIQEDDVMEWHADYFAMDAYNLY